ncbi:MAG: hypothetical protein OEV40_27470, partial [Acidimicrobiia bacterium]|nr:hypothetical protein [Acidimicrobiia bacterium]
MTAVELLGIEGIDEIEALDIEGSAIYRARQFRHNRLVAIKILDRSQEPLMPPARFDLRRSALRRFAAGEGVVSLYGHGVTSAGHRYLIMPYFRMGSLADQLNHGPMPWHRAAELVKRTAEVVAEGHGLRLALGNLKPSSVLLADASSPLVAVYGLATRRFDDGSPSYRAPEVGRGARPAAPADVYSLALILAALIAGRPPNRGSLSREFMTDVASLAPERIVEIIERGLAASPASRHPAADHLALALGRAIGGDEPSLASPSDSTAGDGPIDLDVLLGTQPPPPSDPPPPLIAATSPPPPPMPSADETAGLDPQANDSTIDDHQGRATEDGGTPATSDDDLPPDDDHPAPATGADNRSPMQQAGSLAVIGDTTRRLVLDVAAHSDPTPDQPPPPLLTDTNLGSASDQPPPPLLQPGDRPQVLQTTAGAH